MADLWAVLPAAGTGSRMGADKCKQFLELEGRSLLAWSIAALLDGAALRGVVVALPPGAVARERIAAEIGDSRVSVCAGGATRAESVAAALTALPAAEDDWVLVHDAARPCLPADDVRRLVARVRDLAVGGILAVPVTDTIKRVDPSSARVTDTIDRASLWRALTPQMFRVGELRRALDEARAAGHAVTDEASAMERAGYPVQVVEGSIANIKVTYRDDLPLAAYWIMQRHRESG